MGPLITQGIIGAEWDFVLAFLVGIGFGFSLEQAGFSSSRKLAGVFYGYDFVVIKVFMTAVLTASIGLILFEYFGLIDISLVFINPTYLTSGILGGTLVGLGIILSGFCPGTSFSAAAIGKIDAMVYIGGVFVGVLIFAEAYPLFEPLFTANYLGEIRIYDTLGVSRDVFMLIMVIFAVVMFYATGIIQKKVVDGKTLKTE